MADSQTVGRVRLFHKSTRAQQLVPKLPTPLRLKAKIAASSVTLSAPKDPPKIKLLRGLSKESRVRLAPQGTVALGVTSIHQSPSMRPSKRRHHTPSLNSSLSHSLAGSLHNSRTGSPRGSASMLTLEAINLELRLTALLDQAESVPTAGRSQRRLQAHLEVLEATAKRDPIFGTALKQVKSELARVMEEAKITALEGLQSRYEELSQLATDLKQSAKLERDELHARDRVLENLAKENSLLQKKLEELDYMTRKNGSKSQQNRKTEGSLEQLATDLKLKTRKIKELEDEVRAARVRETKLTELLNWMQEDSARSEAYGVEEDLPTFPTKQQDKVFLRHRNVPVLDLRSPDRSQECSPKADSALNKGFEESASTGTGLLHSPFISNTPGMEKPA